MDIKHVLSCNPLQPAYRPDRPTRGGRADGARTGSITTGGVVEVGHEGDGFAFDNESPRHRRLLRPVRASADRLVTCGEWLAFIADGGYERPELWLSDGWATVQARAVGGAALLGAGRRRLGRCSPWAGPRRSTRRAGRAT